MDRLQIFCLSLIIVSVSACVSDTTYVRSYDEDQRLKLSRGLVEAAGNTGYYQGSPGERALLRDAILYDATYGELHRELAIPYLKRGYPEGMHKHYSDAVKYDPCTWAGYVAYAYLYFLRDYERCIEMCHTIDQCTPDFTDYPQSTSVNYMRGLSFLNISNLDSARHYLELHIEEETTQVGIKYVGIPDQIALAETYRKLGRFDDATQVLSRAVEANAPTAELVYHQALLAIDLQQYSSARLLLDQAGDLVERGAITTRPYVDEFFVPDTYMVDQARRSIE